jgi:hypothetical protein
VEESDVIGRSAGLDMMVAKKNFSFVPGLEPQSFSSWLDMPDSKSSMK